MYSKLIWDDDQKKLNIQLYACVCILQKYVRFLYIHTYIHAVVSEHIVVCDVSQPVGSTRPQDTSEQIVV